MSASSLPSAPGAPLGHSGISCGGLFRPLAAPPWRGEAGCCAATTPAASVQASTVTPPIGSGRMTLSAARSHRGSRGGGAGSAGVVPVHERVEHHIELAVVLPAIDRIVREHDDAPLAGIAARHVDREGAIADLVGAAHQPAQHGGAAADVLAEHRRLIRLADADERAAD